MNDDIIISNGPIKPGPWKVLTIIFGLTTLAAAIVAGYFFVSNDNAQKELAKTRSAEPVAATSPLDNIKTLGFKASDITNASSNSTYHLNLQPVSPLKSFSLSSDGKTVSLTLNCDGASAANCPTSDIEVKFNQAVIDIFAAEITETAGNTVFYLMEDGSVEYTTLASILETGEAKSSGAIEGLSNIAKFYSASYYLSSETSTTASSNTVLAQSINGTIYDTQPLLAAATSSSYLECQEDNQTKCDATPEEKPENPEAQ